MLAHEPRSKSERSGAGAVRQGILAAARQVISSHGVPRLTLEAVAAQAGISKGGLLYHFPTKDAMLQGMLLEHHCGILALCRDQFLADELKERPGRLHRAWIRSERIVSGMEDGLTMGDIAAIVTNPVLSQPLQEFWKGWGTLLAGDGLDEVDSNLIQISLAGLKMVRTMGTCMEARQLEMLLSRLETIATPEQGQKAYEETCSWAVCAHEAWKGT